MRRTTCGWFVPAGGATQIERKPLLDVGDFRVVHDEFAAALAERIAGASSAFQVVEVWTQQVEPIQRARRELEPF